MRKWCSLMDASVVADSQRQTYISFVQTMDSTPLIFASNDIHTTLRYTARGTYASCPRYTQRMPSRIPWALFRQLLHIIVGLKELSTLRKALPGHVVLVGDLGTRMNYLPCSRLYEYKARRIFFETRMRP